MTSSAQPRRVLRVAHVLARLNIGGPAIHVGLACRGLRDRGHVTELFAGPVLPPEGDMAFRCIELGVRPSYIAGLGRSVNPWRDGRALIELISQFRQFRPHVVHTHTSKAGVLGRIAARVAGVPLVVHTFHGTVLQSYFGPLTSLTISTVERLMAALTHRIVVLGQQQKRELVQSGISDGRKIAVVPFGLDLEPFRDAGPATNEELQALGLSRVGPVVGIAGRLAAVKGHGRFLELARSLADHELAFQFLVIGDGELRSELETRCRELGLEKRVVFAGWHRDMTRVYRAMDVLVMTSLNEGSPVVLKEAMAAGVPAVAHAVGGVPDLIDHERTGYLVEPGDLEGLRRHVLRAVTEEEPRRSLVAAARQFVLENHGPDIMLNRLEELYLSALEEREARDLPPCLRGDGPG